MRLATVVAAGALSMLGATPAWAQTAAAPPHPPLGFWIAGGGGYSIVRAGCADCDRAGVFTGSRFGVLDLGFRANPRVDFGVELAWVSSRIETEDPVRTTFILFVGQLRTWEDRGLVVKAGIGLGFAGNGLFSPIVDLEPPFTTNALGIVYGVGWVFRRDRPVTLQLSATHHVAALGELTTVSGASIRNVVGNYWTLGTQIVVR